MSKLNKKAIIIIAAAVLVVIAGGLTGFYFLTRDKGIAAVVNGVKISEEKIEEELAKTVIQYQSQGMNLQPEQMIEVRASVVDNMIIREILIQKSAPLELITDEVETQISTFRSRFETEEEFIAALEVQGFSIETFTQVISEDLKIKKFIEENIPDETSVSDEEISQFYNENPSYFVQPERVHASHILVSLQDKTTDEEKLAMEKILRIENELKNGADFAELAKTESEGPSGPNGGDLGEFTRGQMVAEFEEAAFGLSEGSISGIIKTQFGYHIIKMNGRFPETAVPFEEVKQSINNYLQQEKTRTKESDFIETLKSEAKIRIIEVKTTDDSPIAESAEVE